MHAVVIFLACAALFAGAVYGILRLYKSRNGGLLPWQDAPPAPPTTRGTPGKPPLPK